MGLTDDADENAEQRFDELCLDLNMDSSAKDEAWDNFEKMSRNFTLEGDSVHWLACALYVACRKTLIPTVGRGLMEGNCVSLTRLLRSTRLSLIEFFKKMKKWSDMCNLPQEFRDKVDKLERNFAVSTVIFKKLEPIFLDIFLNPREDPPKQNRSRKQKRLPCSVTDVRNFAWTMFVQVKGNFPAISDDLVNSYHLLLCCIDWFYANALLSNRHDLLNPNFSGLPDHFQSKDYKPPTEVPCIIALLAEKHEGLLIEAKGIKEHWWKPYIKKLFDKKVLKGKVENLTGVLELGHFDHNSKAINHAYEEYVLNVGDFDERIFLGDDADVEIGTPAKGHGGELRDRMKTSHEMAQHFDDTRSLGPSTPLTGRKYLKEKEAQVTPVSTATQSVSKLQALLSGRKTCPSDALLEIFSQCTRDPKDDIQDRVKEMGHTFCTKYAQPSEDYPGSHIDFARKRLQLGESLYYKALENIMLNEKKRVTGRNGANKSYDFSNLLEQDIFHRCLFACCLEIVIFSYNYQRTFPWIIEIFDLTPYYFYKVIEVLIKAEEGLSRDVVKHLNRIEEMILETLAFKSGSPLWENIELHKHASNATVPSVEEVTLPNSMERDAPVLTAQSITSPLRHPAVRRVAGGDGSIVVLKKDPLQSPTGPSASDRFMSPGGAKRRLFDGVPVSTATTTPSSGVQSVQSLLAYHQTQTEDGRQILIPLQVVSSPTKSVTQRIQPEVASANGGKESGNSSSSQSATSKPKKTGSLALFFRKVYHLASVRLQDLCDRLELEQELQLQTWTCFEHTLMHHPELMRDRHLDQLLMCSIYIMTKVTRSDRSFQDIMCYYRKQPQAQSHVYRSVLLPSRGRHMSGSSDASSRAGSGSSSPVSAEKEQKRIDSLTKMRSDSTLPASQPPTPTFEDRGERRGDLIKFYNDVFVHKLKQFAMRFSSHSVEQGNIPPLLSPLPLPRNHPQSPRRVSSNHPVYVSSPKKMKMNTLTPQSRMLYCFSRSPAKDLRAINNMIRMNEKSHIATKRLLQDDNMNDASVVVKKPTMETSSPLFSRKLEIVKMERGQANGSAF